MIFPSCSNLCSSRTGKLFLSGNIVCLIASICPGPDIKSHRLPVSFLGLQLVLRASSLVFDIIDPMKIALGLIVTFASDVKSKSTRVIPI